MKYKIIHETVYTFSSEVFLEPHYLRFKPKITSHTELESFNLHLSITPTGISEQIDAENNSVFMCWFEDLIRKLTIRSDSIVTVHDYNPLNFILYPSNYLNLPFSYSDSLKDILHAALNATAISDQLIEYGQNIKEESNSSTIQFITGLTRQIHRDFLVETRLKGVPHEADKTFNLKKASCRDLSWMQIQLLRYYGIASRFVSGYYYVSIENSEFELHAWVEVFLPGAGWIGLDPSNGIITGNSHIPISTSAHPENTMPVTGSIRGKASSELTSELLIQVIDS